MKLAKIGYELDIRNETEVSVKNYSLSGLNYGIDDGTSHCNGDTGERSDLRQNRLSFIHVHLKGR